MLSDSAHTESDSIGQTSLRLDRLTWGWTCLRTDWPEFGHVLHQWGDVSQSVAAEDQSVQTRHPADVVWKFLQLVSLQPQSVQLLHPEDRHMSVFIGWWKKGAGLSWLWLYSFTHLCMSSGKCCNWFPPMSSHSSAGSLTTQSGMQLKSFMDRSRCCSFFRFLSWGSEDRTDLRSELSVHSGLSYWWERFRFGSTPGLKGVRGIDLCLKLVQVSACSYLKLV